MEFLAQYGYVGLFIAAFLAATILPLSSEVVLTILLLNNLDPTILVIIASLGNVLGSVVNYALGFTGGILFQRKFSTASEKDLNTALGRFKKYGTMSLLFAWLPVIGDPLTVAAGVVRVNIPLFLSLVTIGKLGRYVVISYLVFANGP